MSVTIRAFALAVLAMALIVSVGYSAESTADRSGERRPLVAPAQKNTDNDLLVDMVGFVGARHGAFSYRSDWEERQQAGNVETRALMPAIRTHAARIRLLQDDTGLPAIAPDPPAVSDPFEFREDHSVLRNVQRETWFSGEDIQFMEENSILPMVVPDPPATSAGIKFTEENTILPVRGESAYLSTEQVNFLEENLILPSRESNASVGASWLLPFAQAHGVDH